MSPALGPNQAPTQYVWRAIYRGLKWPGLRKHLRSHLTAKNTKILMYKVLIRPVLTYASETWTLSKTNERRLSLFEREVLRCIATVHFPLGWVCSFPSRLSELVGLSSG